MEPRSGRLTDGCWFRREEEAPDGRDEEEEPESREIERVVAAEPRQVGSRGNAHHGLGAGIREIDQRGPRRELRGPERELSGEAGPEDGQTHGQRSVAGRRRTDPARYGRPSLP